MLYGPQRPGPGPTLANAMRITRREFLKSTALTTAATLLPASASQAVSTSTDLETQRLLTGWEFCRGALGGPWDVWRSDSGNKIAWHAVPMPHCFNARDAVDPDEPYYQGPGWYRNRLKVANPFPEGRTLLHFEGAGQKSEIFLYLDKIGWHVGGYDEFVIDITNAAAKIVANANSHGDLPIAVMCDNSRDLETIPSSLNDFTRFGGLYRYVNLVYVPAISPERVHITAIVQPGQPAHVSVKARLHNPQFLDDSLEILIRLYDPKGSNIHTSSQRLDPWKGEQELLALEVNSPDLWSPSNPALYRCEVNLTSAHGTATAVERFGFRYFEFVAHGPFKLNGERLLLRGTQREEDYVGLGAAGLDELVRAELKLIKDMGANFVGLAHHQQSRKVLELCDELGLLVLEEIPWSRGGLGGDSYRQQARQMLRAMIDQHYNHPSILVWGLGNENDWPGDFPEFDKSQIREFVKEVHEEAHRLDPTRSTFLRRCDFAKDIVDLYSPSIWAGWYHGPYTDYKNASWREMQTVNRFLHLEWGAESHARRHAEMPDKLLSEVIAGHSDAAVETEYRLAGGKERSFQDRDWSETYACNLFDWHLKEQEAMPWLTGSAQWIFKDFSSPLRGDNPVPYVNQKGLVERDLAPKEGYYVFQSYWAQKPMIHIYGHMWPVRWGERDEEKLIKVYSNCDQAELFLNGTSCGVRKRNSESFPAAGLHWLVRFNPGDNHLRAVGQQNAATVKDEIRFKYQTERWEKPARAELRELARHGESVTIEARLFDAKGVLCLDAGESVRFGLTGDGVLLDDIGTSIGSRCVQLYNGRAEITLLTKGGKSVVSVRCESIPTAFITVT